MENALANLIREVKEGVGYEPNTFLVFGIWRCQDSFVFYFGREREHVYIFIKVNTAL